MTNIFVLEEEYEINRRVRQKPNKIENILIWPVLQNLTAIRAFLDIIQYIYYKVLSFTQLTCLLTRFTGKVERDRLNQKNQYFRSYAEFVELKLLCLDGIPYYLLIFTRMLLILPLVAILPKFRIEKPDFFVYNSFTLLLVEQNYDTYRLSWQSLSSLQRNTLIY